MAHALARPEDILVAYDSDTVTLGDQARPLEVRGGGAGSGRPFPEMTGGADMYYSDFTSGLRDFVAARRMAAPAAFADADTGDDITLDGGGPTLVGGWFGGAGADPSAVVLGIDWLAENGADEDSATGDGAFGGGGIGGAIVDVESPAGGDTDSGTPGAADITGLMVDAPPAEAAEPLDRGRAEPPYQAPRFRPDAEAVSEDETSPSLAPLARETRRTDNVEQVADLSFDELALQSATEAPKTEAAEGLGAFIVEAAGPPDEANVDEEDLEGFVFVGRDAPGSKAVGAGGTPWDLDLGRPPDDGLTTLAGGQTPDATGTDAGAADTTKSQ